MNKKFEKSTSTHAFPFWAVHFIDNRLRYLIHNPEKILKDYIKPGDTAIDIGIGGGMFTIGLAKLVGHSGTIISVDFQHQLLNLVERRARKEGLTNVVKLHKCSKDNIDLTLQADFVLSFYMVHEVPSTKNLFKQVHSILKPEGKYLVVEPKVHVTKNKFTKEILVSEEVGFKFIKGPKILFSRSALLEKS